MHLTYTHMHAHTDKHTCTQTHAHINKIPLGCSDLRVDWSFMVTFSLMLAWSHRKLSHFVTCMKEQIDVPMCVAISVLTWGIPQPVHPGKVMAVAAAVSTNTSQLLNWTYYSASAQNGCVAERSGSRPYILSRTTWKWRKIRDQSLCVNSTKARRRWWVNWGILCFAIPPIPVLGFVWIFTFITFSMWIITW